jgi:hypothetical protein
MIDQNQANNLLISGIFVFRIIIGCREKYVSQPSVTDIVVGSGMPDHFRHDGFEWERHRMTDEHLAFRRRVQEVFHKDSYQVGSANKGRDTVEKWGSYGYSPFQAQRFEHCIYWRAEVAGHRNSHMRKGEKGLDAQNSFSKHLVFRVAYAYLAQAAKVHAPYRCRQMFIDADA